MSYNERAQTTTMLVESFQGIWGGGQGPRERPIQIEESSVLAKEKWAS